MAATNKVCIGFISAGGGSGPHFEGCGRLLREWPTPVA